MFNKKNILVTGGTGSFGKMFVLNILKKFKPNKLIIYSRDEMKQDTMFQNMINTTARAKSLRFFLGDVRDYKRLKIAFNDIDYVVHAAALKQVPAAEYNPTEFIKTNIMGAENVIRASIENNVKKVIALSTDKAVNPINLYGATKLVSDKLFISANNYAGKNKIQFSVVRYGNVAGSRGSVIPFFVKLNNEKKIFPITNKDMTRFWITLSEGVDFVINTFSRMKGGEIFIPKIPSTKIMDLAKAINSKFKHKIVGVRPGEKIHELMFSGDESDNVIEFKNYFVLLPAIKNFSPKPKLFLKSNNGEIGKKIELGRSYSSDKNSFLSAEQIRKRLNNI